MKRFHHNDESGFTILQLLVAIGLASLVFAATSGIQLSQLRSKRMIAANEDYLSLDQSLTFELSRIVQTAFALPNCFDAASIATIPIDPANNIDLHYVRDLARNIADNEIRRQVQRTLVTDPTVTGVTGRCRNPRFIGQGGANRNQQNSVYFCLEADTDQNNRLQSVLASTHSFMEVAIVFRNGNNDDLISCRNFINQSDTIAQVFYSVYWIHEDTSEFIYRRKNGSFLISR